MRQQRLAATSGLALVAVGAAVATQMLRHEPSARGAPLNERVTRVAPLIEHTRNGRTTAVVVFQPLDCGRTLEGLDRWNDVWRAGKLDVRGIMLTSERVMPQWRTFLATNGIEFPVELRDRSAVDPYVRSLGFAETPLVVVLDSLHRVRLAAPIAQRLGDETALRAAVAAVNH